MKGIKQVMINKARYRIGNYFSKETEEHCERTAKYVEDMIRYLKFPEYERIVLIGAAQYHDIGKYYIPDKILEAPRALTRLERDVIDMHAFYGYELCKELDYGGKDFQELILLHHGMHKYRTLTDDQIGDFAKRNYPLLVVADMYDALTTNRAYRDAFDHDTALQIIAENEEVQYWAFEALKAITNE